jgi:hypothetical protein
MKEAIKRYQSGDNVFRAGVRIRMFHNGGDFLKAVKEEEEGKPLPSLCSDGCDGQLSRMTGSYRIR